jgi:phospholipid transport system substrate-binding protein
MKIALRINVIGWALGLMVWTHGLAAAGEPTEGIRSAINQGVEILNQSKLAKTERAETIGRLKTIVYPMFDFAEMARRSLAFYWKRLDPHQQNTFVAAFTELLEKTYADKIDLYEGQKVAYTGETMDSQYATVNTKIVSKNDQAFSADYKLRRVEGKWKIYDVVVEGISLVNNYRAQFSRVIERSSFEELIRSMQQKAA